ncbi:MAG TPA: ferrous iron transport protein A [Pirellulales bacterium]|nr:ferrous iron transport protein A [Pirellulales bacterium]
MSQPGVCRLAELAVGKRATVRQIAGGDDVSLRLLEMGLTPGVEVKMVGQAPLGDPIELEVRGYRLSIRKSEAARVEIEPL